MKLTRGFTAFASKVARAAGRPSTVVLCLVVVSAWGISGPFFRFSDTWQLVINSISSVVTLVMAFLIQNTQNRDSSAIQLKLDELIRSTRGAHNALLDLEELTQEELNGFLKTYKRLADEGRNRVRRGSKDTDTPEVIVRTSKT